VDHRVKLLARDWLACQIWQMYIRRSVFCAVMVIPESVASLKTAA